MLLEQRVETLEPDIRWRHIWTGRHEAKGAMFELHVCRAIQAGQLRIYIFKDGEFVSYIFDPLHNVTCAHGSDIESANVDDLVSSAISDIDGNAFDMY